MFVTVAFAFCACACACACGGLLNKPACCLLITSNALCFVSLPPPLTSTPYLTCFPSPSPFPLFFDRLFFFLSAVIVKGTEFFDGKLKRYVDFDITDVLQMTGRAGRPQFDDHGVAVIFVQDTKKHFYKKFMHEPFPVESSLSDQLPNHINAEIVAGTITSKQVCWWVRRKKGGEG